VSQTIPFTPAVRFALIIEGLCQAVARRVGLGGLPGPFIILVWSRLRRLATRFARHAATPSPIPPRPQAVPENVPEVMVASAAKQSSGRPQSASPLLPRPLLPRNRAWLLRLVPEAASGASQLRYFLADPEVASLLAAAPKLQAILRPLCHMLGIRATQALPTQTSPPDTAPDASSSPYVASKQAAPATLPPSTTPPLLDAPPPALARHIPALHSLA
jgi:hypothetical protein